MQVKQSKTNKTMTRDEYINELDSIGKMKADLNRRYSEEHPIMKTFGGKIIRAYDRRDKVWSEPFRLRQVNFGHYGHDVLYGNRIQDGVEKTGLMIECGAASPDDIQECSNL